MAVYLKTSDEIGIMREANQVVAAALEAVRKLAKPGVSTWELDQVAEKTALDHGAKPAFKGYKGSGPYPFPASLCVSVNEEVVHGIPSKERKLKEGDILSVDFGVVYRGFFGDSAVTIPIGKVSPQTERLLVVTAEALELGILQVVEENRIADIGNAIHEHVEKDGFSVVREFVGHGIGRSLHEEPQVPHYRSSGHNERIRVGMVLAIEPMINMGTWQVETTSDGWTQVTKDRKLSAHFEHSVAVTKDGPIVLSRLAKGEVE